MTTQTANQLSSKKCKPCEGGVDKYSREEAEAQLRSLDGWELTDDGRRICKQWQAKDFVSAIDFFNKVADVAEEDGHHPDLHLESYRSARIELWTHAIGGLSENDFILAAKIDEIPFETK